MRKYRTSTESSPDPVTVMARNLAEVMAERSRMNKDLLITLAHAVGANEKVQQKFRNAVLMRLSRIETTVSLIHVAQLAQNQNTNMYYADQLEADAKTDGKYISENSAELSLAMIKYIYGEAEEPAVPQRKRRKRAG